MPLSGSLLDSLGVHSGFLHRFSKQKFGFDHRKTKHVSSAKGEKLVTSVSFSYEFLLSIKHGEKKADAMV